MRTLSISLKPRNIAPKRILTLFSTVLTGVAIIASLVPSSAFADAEKRIDGTGPFKAGDTVTVEFRIPRPTNIQVNPVEIVFVVDASGSLAGAINTAKTQMNTFADWLTGYYGYAKVGIASFGMDEDNSPGLRTHLSLRSIDDSTDVTAMKNAISSIHARSDGLGFSDIQKGIIRGNSLFTDPSTTTASGRHLVLLTDGLANYPDNGSIGFGYPWNGVCPLLPNPARASMSGLRYSRFIIIPQGPTGNQVPSDTRNPDYSGTGLQIYSPPCESYIDTHHGGYLTGMGLIDAMIAHYPGARTKESSMGTTITFLQNVIDPYIIKAHDTINSAVFSSIPDAGVVRNCSNGSLISSNNTVGGTGLTIDTNSIPYNPSVALYCVRFRATIKTPISSGTYDINRTDLNNWIRFYNVYNTVIASNGIEGGSITITGDPDMATTEHWLTNNSGTQKRVFNINESIYVHTKIENVGDSTMPAGFATAFYKNRSASTAANTASDIPMYIIGHGALSPGSSRTYDSAGSGTFPSTSDPNSVVGNPRSWSSATAGNFTALTFTNYTNAAEPNFPTNNRRTTAYSVITPPSNLRTNNLLCYRTDLLWNAGSSNITGYDVQVTDVAAMLTSILNGTPYNDYVTYNHSVSATPTTMSASSLKPSTLYSWVLTPKTINGSGSPVSVNFTTPACPTYNSDIGGPYALNPGQSSDTIVNVNIDYLPSPAVWTDHGSSLTISVVGINYNNQSCAAYSANGAPFTGDRDGLTARVSGNPSQASRTVSAPTSPVTFTVQSTPDTNTGRYTICFGIFSPDSYITKTEVKPVHINVELQPWVQIDRPAAATSSMVGDVHSNASINISVPLNQYFFKNGTAGVVTSTGSVSNIPNDRLSNIANKLWRIPSYAEQVKTEAYDNLLSLAESSLDDPADGLPSGLPETANLAALCAQGSKAYEYTPASGTWTRNGVIDLANTSGCSGVNLVFFINGSIAHNANVVDGTNNSTITFIAKDDVTTAATVTQLDGVHIFGGSFRDGSVYNTSTGTVDQPLVVNGSLIGLATQSPVSTKGTFSQGAISGLQRNLSFGASGNDTVPAERIIYQPKYLYLLRDLLGSSSFTWSE